MNSLIRNLFPFVRWFPLSMNGMRADIIAGITIALILVPQSMAYAQLAGLPVVYGLYASFVPVIVAALWGSSSQLHTGPVAMLSLMSMAAIIPYATPGSDNFIELSIMLALIVGVLRLALGLFRLGAIVNLLSSPVIVGFTNAAALIIGLSQLSKILGVPFPRTDNYLADLWRVIEQVPSLHWATLAFAVGTWLLIAGIKRFTPAIPGILVAVVLTTVVSGLVGYEQKTTIEPNQISNQQAASDIKHFADVKARIDVLINEIAEANRSADELIADGGMDNISEAAQYRAQVSVYENELNLLKAEKTQMSVDLYAMVFNRVDSEQGSVFYLADNLPAAAESDGKTWRFSKVSDEGIILSAGGAVVGDIPEGLPSFNVPNMQWDLLWGLFPVAMLMALIGFMEATSISKAIASDTGEKVDTSKELVGQGLANIAGSFFGSYTVSGSFSRSAVAAKAGAVTGIFAIVSALGVVLVLLFFTEYLYHLPQAVLAVIVMMAVFSLIRIKPLTQAWKVDRFGAVIGVITFVATLLMAPKIANGIILGVILTVLHYLLRTMKPRTDVISRKADGSLGGIEAHELSPMSECYIPLRFDGSLNFINVAYFEDMLLEAQRRFPQAKTILIIGSGINDIDASGEEKVRELADSLREKGIELIFSSLKHQVKEVFDKAGLTEEIGPENFFGSQHDALDALNERYQLGCKQ